MIVRGSKTGRTNGCRRRQIPHDRKARSYGVLPKDTRNHVTEISLRVWDVDLGAWFYFELCAAVAGCSARGPLVNPFEDKNLDEESLSRSSELRDRRGLVIYEGDILRDRAGTTCTVVYRTGCFRLSTGPGAISWPLSSNSMHYEVVGSSYEFNLP